jgi:hypothetical protein
MSDASRLPGRAILVVNLTSHKIRVPDSVNLILGQAHFIKTVEDLHEALVTAVPVAPPRAMSELRMLVDEVEVLHTSERFFGISQFYEQFPQAEDDKVIACLETVRAMLHGKEKTPA